MLAAALLLLIAASPPIIEERVDSSPADIESATGGLVRDGTRLVIDIANLFGDEDWEAELAGLQTHLEQVFALAASEIEEERADLEKGAVAADDRRQGQEGAEWTSDSPAP